MDPESKVVSSENYSSTATRTSGDTDADVLKEILKDTPSEGTIPKTTEGEKKVSFNYEQPSTTKIRQAFKYIKVTVLVIVLLIALVLLARVEEHESKFQQIAIAVNEKEKMLFIPTKRLDWPLQEIGLEMRGPFLAQEPLNKDEKTPSLSVCVATVQKRISKTQVFLFNHKSEFDRTAEELKIALFNLDDDYRGKPIFLMLTTNNVDDDIGLALYINSTPISKDTSIIFGLLILIFLYLMIVTEVVDRTYASMVCAGLAMAVLALYHARPSSVDILRWIDVDTLALLVGMMILVAILAESGIFDYFAVYAFKVAKGRPWPLINCLCFFTALLATFLDSVTMMLLATPVTIRLCEVLSLDPVTVLILMVVFANVGAAVTPVGDPPNVMISQNSVITSNNVNFGSFFLHMLPGVVLSLLQCYVHARLLYRKPESLHCKETDDLIDLRQEIAIWERTAASISPVSQDEDMARETITEKINDLKKKLADAEDRGSTVKEKPTFEETLAQLTALYPLRNKWLLLKAGITFAFVIVLFLCHSLPAMKQVSLGWMALIGAFLLIILANKRDLEIVLARVEWTTLLFFAALFIVMECLAELGVISLIGKYVTYLILSVDKKYRLLLAIFVVLWVTAIASAFLDNIPVTTMMIKIIINLSQDKELGLPLQPLVWSLAYGACFGGNGTLIGASANVVTAGVAEQHGYKITFLKFFIVCFPLMIGSVAVANIYLLIAHVAFEWHDK